MTTETKTAEDATAEQVREYGTYRATQPIRIDGVLAFQTGDPVPVSTVERENSPIDPDAVEKVPAGEADTSAAATTAKPTTTTSSTSTTTKSATAAKES